MERPDPAELIERLCRAMNDRDLDSLVACFGPDYCSEHPVHPSDSLRGHAAIRRKWSKAFREVPDFCVEPLRLLTNQDTAWVEWRWRGTQLDGTPVSWAGVAIFGVAHGQIVWGRPYMELVDEPAQDASARRFCE